MKSDPMLLTRRAATLGLMAGIVGAAAPANSHHLLIGSYGGAGCTGLPEIKAFESWLGHPLGVVLDFLQKDTWNGMLGEASWIAGCWKSLPGCRLALSVPMLVDTQNPTLAQGATGEFDQNFRDLASILVAGGYPDAFIRIGWEFNGDWYRWAAQDDPSAYARFWRRIALAMKSVPGARFRFDWNPTIADGPTEAAYPGDDVVDIIGLDVYNQSWPSISSPTLRWEYLLLHPNGLMWHRNFAAAHGKPRSFPEWGTGTRPDGHGGGDDPEFIRNMLAWMQTGGPVEYGCYWNYRAPDYDAKVTDGRLPRAAAALRSGLDATP
jgi:Glycosyl hydrolase family 26